MEPPTMSSPVQPSSSPSSDAQSVPSRRLIASSEPAPSTSISPSTHTFQLGDFSKLRGSVPILRSSDTSSPSDSVQTGSVKLGDFSKLLSRLTPETSQKSSPTAKMAYNFTQYSPANNAGAAAPGFTTYMHHLNLSNNSSYPYPPPAPAPWAHTHPAYSAAQYTVSFSRPQASSAYISDTEEARSHHTDSDSDAICTPATTPPSSAEKDVSPIAAAVLASHPLVTPTVSLTVPQSTQSAPLLSYQLYRGGAVIPLDLPRRSREKKHESLTNGLIQLRAMDALLAKNNPTVADNGVHVFLDMSNINISFHKTMRLRNKLPDYAHFMPLPNLNLEFLTELLVRGRDAKVLNVGCSVQPGRSEPQFVHDLRKLNYRVDLRERKPLPQSPPRYDRNYHSSDDDAIIEDACVAAVAATRAAAKTRYAEDLVDETLQTRIAESVMEYHDRRGTLVIVTGDAKPAKYSDGFFAYADRALKMGWNVEVVSWKSSLSSSWSNPAWKQQWGDRFRIIKLDTFLDDLLACYA